MKTTAQDAAIDQGINHMIKYKVSAVLAMDEKNKPGGVVSKTDIMGAYYANLPIDSPLESIMSSPPLFCRTGDSLAAALYQMQSNAIYRIYVTPPDTGNVVGALAYPDIVGLLYRYCHVCEYSRFVDKDTSGRPIARYRVRDVMSQPVKSFSQSTSLVAVIEGLSAFRFRAVLITADRGEPSGVISKSDLALAYKHGIPTETTAGAIMSQPLCCCTENEYLEIAIQSLQSQESSKTPPKKLLLGAFPE